MTVIINLVLITLNNDSFDKEHHQFDLGETIENERVTRVSNQLE